MHLRSISIVGFKSFADRTRLVFEPGVTVVVGPNGSGKSNLVDAIAWVLGTQATKALRTPKMEDVIFAGTALRPSLGRAEVRLTLDNADGRVPLDLPEVTVTRRLYRDGTSEYEINGTSCRLLDVQELLSDSGVGRHQHIIVGQGRVDAVLNAGPEEHRAIIEEAAGVVKHRQRRDRALRRLEATDVDVTRISDLLEEQQRRMRPLRRQARAFERHADVKERWRALRLWLGGQQLRDARARIGEVDAARIAGTSRLSAAEAELVSLRETLAGLRAAAGETTRALERDTAAAARLETALERFQRLAMVARERRSAVERRVEGVGERRSDLEEESADLAVRLERAVVEAAEARQAVERREVALRALEDEDRSLADQHLLPPEGVVATARGDLAALESADRRDLQELADVERRRGVIGGRIEEEAAEIERLREEIRRADATASGVQEAYERAAVESRREQGVLETCEDAVREAAVERAGARARVEALESALAGLGDPEARRIAEAHDAVVGAATAGLDVPEFLAAAVDAALGEWADALVAESPDRLGAAAGALKSAGRGGVGFVAAPAGAQAPARKVAAAVGVDALIDVLGPGAAPDLAATLLGDVLLVEGWQTAWEVVRRHPQIRAVTPDGDLVTARGIRVADPEGTGPAVLEAAAVALERSETAVARAESRLHAARRAFEGARGREREALEAVEAVEARIAGATEALRLVERSRAEADAELARLVTRADAINESRRVRLERMSGLRSRIEDFDGPEAREAWEALERRRSEVAERREAARRDAQSSAAALAAAEERVVMLERRAGDVARVLAGLDRDRPDPTEAVRLAGVEERARRAMDLVGGHLRVLRERQRELRDGAGEAGRLLADAEERRDLLEPAIAESREEMTALAIEAAELRVREESIAEGLRRDVDASEEAALEAPRPELDQDADPASHLATLEAELRRLGPVNPLAAAEYRELEERAEFLRTQLDDLESSRRDLRKVISALDGEIARLFREAFADVARGFEEHFTVLFPGGRGKLRLTDPDDPLSSGVDIHAQPLGKKVGALSLLSGGERSLAALAFLFAVFRARPSPFYVLDEVEAALDDANLRRFIRLVATLRETSQLVIVTHQQQTMEAADLLYGVTMEPGESSRVLAKRLSGAGDAAGAAPAEAAGSPRHRPGPEGPNAP